MQADVRHQGGGVRVEGTAGTGTVRSDAKLTLQSVFYRVEFIDRPTRCCTSHGVHVYTAIVTVRTGRWSSSSSSAVSQTLLIRATYVRAPQGLHEVEVYISEMATRLSGLLTIRGAFEYSEEC
jgi:hypothetical protein